MRKEWCEHCEENEPHAGVDLCYPCIEVLKENNEALRARLSVVTKQRDKALAKVGECKLAEVLQLVACSRCKGLHKTDGECGL